MGEEVDEAQTEGEEEDAQTADEGAPGHRGEEKKKGALRCGKRDPLRKEDSRGLERDGRKACMKQKCGPLDRRAPSGSEMRERYRCWGPGAGGEAKMMRVPSTGTGRRRMEEKRMEWRPHEEGVLEQRERQRDEERRCLPWGRERRGAAATRG